MDRRARHQAAGAGAEQRGAGAKQQTDGARAQVASDANPNLPARTGRPHGLSARGMLRALPRSSLCVVSSRPSVTSSRAAECVSSACACRLTDARGAWTTRRSRVRGPTALSRAQSVRPGRGGVAKRDRVACAGAAGQTRTTGTRDALHHALGHAVGEQLGQTPACACAHHDHVDVVLGRGFRAMASSTGP